MFLRLVPCGKSLLSPWSFVMGLVALMIGGGIWFSVTAGIILLVIPTVLAAALLNPKSAALVSVWETALLLLLGNLDARQFDALHLSLACAGIWAMVGLMFAVYHPMYQINRWSWQQY